MGDSSDDGQSEPDSPSSSDVERADERRRERATKEQLKALNNEVNDTTPAEAPFSKLAEFVDRADALLPQVKGPAMAVIDDNTVLRVSDLGVIKSKNLRLDPATFDASEFLAAAGRLMGRPDLEGGFPEASSELQARWLKVGRVLARHSYRVPALDHMYGPLSIQPKEKRARQARAAPIDEIHRVHGDEVIKEDDKAKDKETARMVVEVNRILVARAPHGMPYLKFVINPHSFGETVTNVFLMAFLVNEGRVVLDEVHDPKSDISDIIVMPYVEPEDDSDDSAEPPVRKGKSHHIFSLDYKLWRDSIELYDITESVIPSWETPDK